LREPRLTIALSTVAGEQVEMGGIVDPERGALVYRKTTQVETVEPGLESNFTTKKVKTVTSESSWLGQGKEPQKDEVLVGQPTEVKPWRDEEVETNPLYSDTEYLSDFNNPMYSHQHQDREEGEASPPPPIGGGDEIPLVPIKSRGSGGEPTGDDDGYADYLSGVNKDDTLF
jgi:hypothetical protein